MRGAPHSGLSRLIVRIKSRMSAGTAGRPTRRRDFQRQYRRKPLRCQRTSVSGLKILLVLIKCIRIEIGEYGMGEWIISSPAGSEVIVEYCRFAKLCCLARGAKSAIM